MTAIAERELCRHGCGHEAHVGDRCMAALIDPQGRERFCPCTKTT